MPDTQKKKNAMERELFNFVWNGKRDKIARKTVVQSYEKGGLKMASLKSFIASLSLTWIRRIFCANTGPWRKLTIAQCPMLIRGISDFRSDFVRMYLVSKSKNNFWKGVFLALQNLMRLCEGKNYSSQVPLWYNECIKIGEKTVFLKEWYQKGILFVSDLINDDGTIIDYEVFCTKFNFRPLRLNFYGIIRNIKRMRINHLCSRTFGPFKPSVLDIILKFKKGCRNIYNELLFEFVERPISEIKWENDLLFHRDNKWWKKVNSSVFQLNDTKLSWLQYRVLYRILGTKCILYKMHLTNDNLCSFCAEHRETVYHLFWECRHVSQIWESLSLWFNRHLENVNYDFSLFHVIFCHENNIVNILLCVVKSFIFAQRNKNTVPNVVCVQKEIQQYITIQRKIYIHKDKQEIFNKLWSPFIPLLINPN